MESPPELAAAAQSSPPLRLNEPNRRHLSVAEGHDRAEDSSQSLMDAASSSAMPAIQLQPLGSVSAPSQPMQVAPPANVQGSHESVVREELHLLEADCSTHREATKLIHFLSGLRSIVFVELSSPNSFSIKMRNLNRETRCCSHQFLL